MHLICFKFLVQQALKFATFATDFLLVLLMEKVQVNSTIFGLVNFFIVTKNAKTVDFCYFISEFRKIAILGRLSFFRLVFHLNLGVIFVSIIDTKFLEPDPQGKFLAI